ncbi:MAG: hypothetical protein OXI23_18620 [Gemmatimonadota bacterium]|nr:hypothetical protein [Gemmatimonadota bacterium]
MSFGVETAQWPGAPITGRWHEELGVVIASGQGDLKRGQVMAKANDGKWYKWVRETALAPADTDNNRGTARSGVAITAGTKDYHFALKHKNIAPGTLSIKSAVDANDSHRYTDDGHGRLTGKTSDGQYGIVDYRSGIVHIHWEANQEADDLLCTYRYGDQHGKTFPAGILVDDEVKNDAANDTSGTVVVIGEVVKSRLIWPGSTAAADITRALAHLESLKIYAI